MAKTWSLKPSRKDPNKHVLLGPYDSDFVEDLKQAVPSHARAWRTTAKYWLIDDAYADAAREVIASHTQVEAPSQLVGLPLVTEGGQEVGTITGVQSQPLSAIVKLNEVEPTFDSVRLDVDKLGVDKPSAEVWEVLELVGKPVSVTVREVDGRRFILAEVEPAKEGAS